MKTFLKFCLTFISLSYSISVFSQNLISENKVWSIVTEGGMEQPWTRTTSYKFSGDTTIHQMQYKKLYISEDEQKKDWKLNSLWVENNDSVFQYSLASEENLLIYDFNISEKDSFLNLYTDNYLYVDSIRTREWGIGVRKLIYFHSKEQSNLHTIWINGVGQNGDITRSSEAGVTGGFSSILCFEENGELVYQNPNYNSCSVFTSVTTIKKEPKFVEVYSTCENLITVNPLIGNPGIFQVYDLIGNKIVQKEIELMESKIRLPSTGIYIYRFITKTGEIQTGKVLVD